MNDGLKVNIFSIKDGLIELDDVLAIRIKSTNYNILIMKDHMPIIGDIDGYISFQMKESMLEYSSVKAYYTLKRNEFNLIIRKEK